MKCIYVIDFLTDYGCIVKIKALFKEEIQMVNVNW